MECSFCKKLLEDYKMDKLDKERLLILKSHIAKCDQCHKDFSSISIQKYFLRILILMGVLTASILLINQSINKSEMPSTIDGVSTKIVSTIVIDVDTADPKRDREIIKNLSNYMKLPVTNTAPLSIRIAKVKVKPFIGRLFSIVKLPQNTPEKIFKFVEPLKSGDEIIVEINFLKENT